MFAALNINRNNISNAVSDNLLDDLGLTQSDYVSRSHDTDPSVLPVTCPGSYQL